MKWSFEELGSLSRKAANVLSGACGLQPGDRVIAVLPRVPEWWLLNVACMRAGQSLPDWVGAERKQTQATSHELHYREENANRNVLL